MTPSPDAPAARQVPEWTGAGMMRAMDPPAAQRESAIGRYQGLPAEARVVWQLENVVGTAAALAVAVAVFHGPWGADSWRTWELPVVGLVVAIALLEALVVIPRRHRYYRYALFDDSVVVVRGRLYHRCSIYPLRQVLYVETRQGPLLRRYGLLTLHLGTISEPHTVGPLERAVAEELRRAVQVGAPAT